MAQNPIPLSRDLLSNERDGHLKWRSNGWLKVGAVLQIKIGIKRLTTKCSLQTLSGS